MESPDMESPDMESPDMESPDMESPDMESPDMESPDMDSPDIGQTDTDPFDLSIDLDADSPSDSQCGDAILQGDEECDTGGESPLCNHNCTLAYCGDGTLNPAAGEECDDASESEVCNHNCTYARCGDQILNLINDEECDDGGSSALCTAGCQLRANQLSFREVAATVGLGDLYEHQGVAVADYDQDGYLDLFVVSRYWGDPTSSGQGSRLFRNLHNGRFEDVTVRSGLATIPAPVTTPPRLRESDRLTNMPGDQFGASWGDYDQDGYPDLLLTGYKTIHLYQNIGGESFMEVTELMGLSSNNECLNLGATWFDFDRDGDLDLYLCDWGLCDMNRLYRNDGALFTDVTELQMISELPSLDSMTAIPVDINEDGWLDLYVTNDFRAPNWLLINHEGAYFTEEAQSFRLNNRSNDMGVAFSDYDRDGNLDLYITTINDHHLLVRNDRGTFVNRASAVGVRHGGWGWSVLWSDFDLDGDDDLFISTGFLDAVERNRYYRNEVNNIDVSQNLLIQNETNASARFTDLSDTLELGGLTVSFGAVELDYDHDGDLDVVFTDSSGQLSFLENMLRVAGVETRGHWLQVSLEGVESNPAGIGAEVTAMSDHHSIRKLHTGISFLSQSITPIHIGLGVDSVVNELVVKWPSGIEERYYQIEADQLIKIREGEGVELLDSAPLSKHQGCGDSSACNFDATALVDDASCMYQHSGNIVGPNTVNLLIAQDYRYSSELSGITEELKWEVEGGELISGQGENQVRVRWGVTAPHTLRVISETPDCRALPRELTVQVSLDRAELERQRLSIARLWGEVTLQAIREDYARPPVHARNLFHVGVAMYDSWALYHQGASTYLIGHDRRGFDATLTHAAPSAADPSTLEKTLSYAVYYLLRYRFRSSPNAHQTLQHFNRLMSQLGYPVYPFSLVERPEDLQSSPWASALDPATKLGVEIASLIIRYGFQDGSGEEMSHENTHYVPVNDALFLGYYRDDLIELADPNRWQPLRFNQFVDQSGHIISEDIPSFIGAEWGDVSPFALTDQQTAVYERQGTSYLVYLDPGAPPQLQLTDQDLTLVELASHIAYQQSFALVSVWSSQLDPLDGVVWDISPHSLGGMSLDSAPVLWEDYLSFYQIDRGDLGRGHQFNPYTGSPYESVYVPRGDYTRVIAEFWADGPDSETPPGHWFTLLNYVNDNPLSDRRMSGVGPELSPLEWEVKSYLTLGGAMHDAAIAAWSVKGWYDYIRPISAIRFMARLGQSSDPSRSNYHFAGLPLIPGLIEEVMPGDPLAGADGQYIGALKAYTRIRDDLIYTHPVSASGSGWILAWDWWPYQRPSFVTPPFAGYVSGHSTFSRAAAEVLTELTGNRYFPGGYGEFVAQRDEFLVFDVGPSVDVPLRWATYQDAADQSALSRIWGGIHPPVDDLPGRRIGETVGRAAFDRAVELFQRSPEP